jgi:hypothetical protein
MKKPRNSAPKTHLNDNRQERLGTANLVPPEESAVLSKKDPVGTARKVAAKPMKGARRPQRTAASSDPEKLLCRYCGSDDFAPSFIKRRDARCRTCFKQRYGSATHAKSPKSPKANAEK